MARLCYVQASQYTALSPAAIKTWLWLAWKHPSGNARVHLVDLAMEVGMGTRKARAGLVCLAEAGVLSFEASTDGYVITLPYTERFTFVPDAAVPMLLRLPDRAAKTFVAMARIADNKTRSLRARLGTVAALVGRCARAVQMAIADLAGAMLVSTVRTGRSSIFVLGEGGLNPAVQPPVAHHSDLLLRLLRSTPEQELSRILGRAQQEGKDTIRIRDSLVTRQDDTETKTLERVLKRVTGSLDEARALLARFRPFEIWNALERIKGRSIRDPYRYLTTVIRRGWCAA